MKVITMLALVLILATSAMAVEHKAVQMKDDFGTEPLYNTWLSYYYYIPCTTSSWFWAYTVWTPGDIVGSLFTIGDPTMGIAGSGCPPYTAADPCNAVTIEQFRILDFAGYGTIYPGLWTVEFDVYCANEVGCPIGSSIWNSGPIETGYAWNYIVVPGGLCVTDCATQGLCYPRFLFTATMTGTDATYPAFGFDNIQSHLNDPDMCAMHDIGCCPALYPRPYNSHYSLIHSGFYGPAFTYCPPQWFLDGGDDGSGQLTGFIELAWRAYLVNTGPTATEPSTWGNIKAMYR